MSKTEKRINKWLIGLVIGSAVVGGLSLTPRGKSFWGRTRDRIKSPARFMRSGFREMRKTMMNKENKDGKREK